MLVFVLLLPDFKKLLAILEILRNLAEVWAVWSAFALRPSTFVPARQAHSMRLSACQFLNLTEGPVLRDMCFAQRRAVSLCAILFASLCIRTAGFGFSGTWEVP